MTTPATKTGTAQPAPHAKAAAVASNPHASARKTVPAISFVVPSTSSSRVTRLATSPASRYGIQPITAPSAASGAATISFANAAASAPGRSGASSSAQGSRTPSWRSTRV